MLVQEFNSWTSGEFNSWTSEGVVWPEREAEEILPFVP